MAPRDPAVLILTQDFDPTVDPVVHALKERDVPLFRADLSYFPQRMTVTCSDFGPGGAWLTHGERRLDLGHLAGVWYRRPTAFEFDPSLGEAEQQFARNEGLHGVGGILRATDCLWVNRPDLDAVAELKPHHCAVARRLGMRVPRTLVTNDPDEVERLLAETRTPVVYKALTGGVVHYPGAFPNGLYTTVLTDEIRDHLHRVRHTVCTFQEYVEKDHEIRLTVIGNTYFPVRIASQTTAESTVDWRAAQDMPYAPYEPLPDAVVAQVQAMLEEFGIVYAAIDFIVRPDGEFVFLEVNPGGQFMWMEFDLELGMADCMAELLAAGGPFRRGEVTQIGY